MKRQIVIFLSLFIFHSVISFSFNFKLFNHYKKSENEDSNENLDILQIIRKEGYPAEAHVVLTEDGYILTMHRIVGKSGSPTIFLQHGVLGCSMDWIVLGKQNSLAYSLADNGYDVWLGNFRGNTYSKAHISLSPKNLTFWDFSWHESGIYDLPAMITYIVKLKENSLRAYIGFSMGTTCFYVMASERPQITKLIQSMYSLAPVAFLKHIRTPLRYLTPFASDFKRILYLFGDGAFLPNSFITRFLAKYLCDMNFQEEKICSNILFILVGFDENQFNYTLLPKILNYQPAGTSSKTMVHFVQEIKSGNFQQYNYGIEKNLLIYNSPEPPRYNLSKITIPIVLFYGNNDWLSSPQDVIKLTNELPKKPIIYKVPYAKFNHIDFLWAMDAPKLVYKKVLKMLKEPLYYK